MSIAEEAGFKRPRHLLQDLTRELAGAQGRRVEVSGHGAGG